MRRFHRLTGARVLCLWAVLALAAGGVLLWSRPGREPMVETRTNSAGVAMRAVRLAGGEGIGGHHFDEDYDKLADIITKAVEKRLAPRAGR